MQDDSDPRIPTPSHPLRSPSPRPDGWTLLARLLRDIDRRVWIGVAAGIFVLGIALLTCGGARDERETMLVEGAPDAELDSRLDQAQVRHAVEFGATLALSSMRFAALGPEPETPSLRHAAYLAGELGADVGLPSRDHEAQIEILPRREHRLLARASYYAIRELAPEQSRAQRLQFGSAKVRAVEELEPVLTGSRTCFARTEERMAGRELPHGDTGPQFEATAQLAGCLARGPVPPDVNQDIVMIQLAFATTDYGLASESLDSMLASVRIYARKRNSRPLREALAELMILEEKLAVGGAAGLRDFIEPRQTLDQAFGAR